jgi:hypothetical protein
MATPSAKPRTPRKAKTPAASIAPAGDQPIADDRLIAHILRTLRRHPNRSVDLGPLAEELNVEPFRMQLTVERLGRRGMVVVPFIEPGTAGGATLTEKGLRWLIESEGGKPADKPVAFQPAKQRVRAGDEAERLPRAQVYGVRPPS